MEHKLVQDKPESVVVGGQELLTVPRTLDNVPDKVK